MSKKMRCFLIIFSIMLSTGVFFASIAISDSFLESVTNSIKVVVGVADLTITPTEETRYQFVSRSNLEPYKDDIDYIYGEMDTSAIYKVSQKEKVALSIRGMEIEALDILYPFGIVDEINANEFNGKKALIGKDFAKTYDLKVGDSLKLQINGYNYHFEICGIAAAKGPFNKAKGATTLVIPKDCMRQLMKLTGKDNRLFIKFKDGADVDKLLKEIESDYATYEVKRVYNNQSLKLQLANIQSIFLILSGIVLFMSAFIICSSFKVIAVERIPIIGTLRSIGATKKVTNAILLGESLIYGLVGGSLGLILGVGLLYVLSIVMQDMANVAPGLELRTSITYTALQQIIVFSVAMILSLISAMIPIIKTSSLEIKAVILRTFEDTEQNKKVGLFIAVICLIATYGLTIPTYDPDDNLGLGSALFLTLIAIVLIIPYLVKIFTKVFGCAYNVIFGNIGLIATKNLNDNKCIINNIIMLAISIAILITINTSGYNMVLSSLNSYKNAYFDISVSSAKYDKHLASKFKNITGIADVYENYEFDDLKVEGTDQVIGTVKGIDTEKFLEFWSLSSKENLEPLIAQLDNGRKVLLSNQLKTSLKVEKGDLVQLKTESGTKAYEVIGFFNNFMNDSDYAIVSKSFIKLDMKNNESSSYYLKARKGQELTEITENLKNIYSDYGLKMYTKKQLELNEIEDNANSTSLMQSFCIIAIVIGFFGVVNNLVLSCIQRKHALAMFKSIGMSKVQVTTMLMIESLTSALIGGIMGAIGGILMSYIMCAVNKESFQMQSILVYIYILTGIVVMLGTSIIPIRIFAKLKIVESLKYE